MTTARIVVGIGVVLSGRLGRGAADRITAVATHSPGDAIVDRTAVAAVVVAIRPHVGGRVTRIGIGREGGAGCCASHASHRPTVAIATVAPVEIALGIGRVRPRGGRTRAGRSHVAGRIPAGATVGAIYRTVAAKATASSICVGVSMRRTRAVRDDGVGVRGASGTCRTGCVVAIATTTTGRTGSSVDERCQCFRTRQR